MQIQLEQFEGPLGLLLFLIKKEEMDIYDIPIHHITHQYLEYVKKLKTIDLEQAGDFVAMAATLIQIKAKMLLPNSLDDGEDSLEEDPRKPLVQRLLEYQRYQDAGKQLYDRPLLGRDIWKKGFKEEIEGEEGELILEENALFSLISSYRAIVKKAQKATHRVASKLQSIASRILEMSKKLVLGKRVELKEFIEEDIVELRKLVITFLSSLELGKLGYINLYQDETYGPLFLEAKKEVGGDVITQVEEYGYVEQDLDINLDLKTSQLSVEEQNYLQNDDAVLEEKVIENMMKAPLADNEVETDSLEGVEAATDEDIDLAEKELNILNEPELV